MKAALSVGIPSWNHTVPRPVCCYYADDVFTYC